MLNNEPSDIPKDISSFFTLHWQPSQVAAGELIADSVALLTEIHKIIKICDLSSDQTWLAAAIAKRLQSTLSSFTEIISQPLAQGEVSILICQKIKPIDTINYLFPNWDQTQSILVTFEPNPSCFPFWHALSQQNTKIESNRSSEVDTSFKNRYRLAGQAFLGKSLTMELLDQICKQNPALMVQIKSIQRSVQPNIDRSPMILAKIWTAKNITRKFSDPWKPLEQFSESISWNELFVPNVINLPDQPQSSVMNSLQQDYKIKALEHQLMAQESLIKELNQTIEDKEEKLQTVQNSLEYIYDSNSWRFIQKLWGIRMAILPKGSKRDLFVRNFAMQARKLLGIKVSTNRRFRELKVLKNQHKNELEQILETNRDVKDVIVFAPSILWDNALFQRPQQLAMAFAQKNCLVIYCEPAWSSHKPGFRKVQDRLYSCFVDRYVFEDMNSPIVMVLAYNREWLDGFCNPRVVYEYIDNLSILPGSPKKNGENHRWLATHANLALATAVPLLNELQKFRADAILCPNGVDYDHFQASRIQPYLAAPQDLLPIVQEQKSIIGYYGALARWFDYNLVRQIAIQRSDWNFVLIGNDYDQSLRRSKITSLPNVFWLGTKDYHDLPNYLKFFDIAMIPFLLNDITHATSPLKLFEFMAGGKPVVVTPMKESIRFDGIFIGGSPDEFIQKIEQGLIAKDNPEYLGIIDKIARQNTWKHRAEQILWALHAR